MKLFFLLLILQLEGCASLPEYALPHFTVMGNEKISSEQGVTYRALTVNDFRASSLPIRLAGHEKQFYAHSSIRIRLTKDSKFILHSAYSQYFNQIIWSGKIKFVAFEAVLLPDASWWNPAVPENKRAYVLQHEQIHFALMELTARRLSQQVKEDLVAIRVVDSTLKGVRDQLLEEVKNIIDARKEEMLKEHTAFDQDASLYYAPEKQQWWYDRVNRQLHGTVLRQ